MGLVRGIAVGNMTVTGVVQAVDTESGKLVVVSKVLQVFHPYKLKWLTFRAGFFKFGLRELVSRTVW